MASSSSPAAAAAPPGPAASPEGALAMFLDRMASMPDVSEIYSWLHLGSAAGAVNKAKLEELNVKVIVNATRQFPNAFEKKQPGLFEYERFPLDDTLNENAAQYFDSAADVIARAKRGSKGVLVHCMMGVSRSPSLVLAYLMKHEKMPLKDALAFLRSKRKVNPNSNFLGQLMQYETTLGRAPSLHIAKLSECRTAEETRAHVLRVFEAFQANRERTEVVIQMRELLTLSGGGPAIAALREAMAAMKREAGEGEEVLPPLPAPAPRPAPGGPRVLRTIRADAVVAEAEERGRAGPGSPREAGTGAGAGAAVGARRASSEGPEPRRPARAASTSSADAGTAAAQLLAALSLRADKS